MLLQRISASATCLFFCFASSTLANNSTTGPVVHEAIPAVPKDWSHAGAPAPSQTMILQIALQQQNLDQLESKIYAISTPGNPSYGHYMEGDEVKAMLAPSSDASHTVEAWLKSAGVTKINSDGEWITFATTVDTANKLLGTQFNYYESDGVTKLRTTEYSLPNDVAQHIDFVTPTTYFGKTTALLPTLPSIKRTLEPRQASNSTSNHTIDNSCKTSITPDCLKQIYSIGDYTPDPKSGSKIAFSSFLKESARTQDLTLFQQRFNIPKQGFTVQLINGGVDDQAVSDKHGEANLDAENISGISHPLPVTEYITGGSPPFVPNVDEPTAADNQNEPYLNFYQYLLAQKNADLPQVISNSYGDDEQTVPEKYARRVCNMIGQLGMRGISVLESSGDTGVGAGCLSNDGKKTPQFTPQFPGTCPYITAVGGTQALEPEVAWVASSGGFSYYFQQPSYQSAAVEGYLNNELNNPSYYEQYFNKSGRGFPDVSAHSLTPEYVLPILHLTSILLFLLLVPPLTHITYPPQLCRLRQRRRLPFRRHVSRLPCLQQHHRPPQRRPSQGWQTCSGLPEPLALPAQARLDGYHRRTSDWM